MSTLVGVRFRYQYGYVTLLIRRPLILETPQHVLPLYVVGIFGVVVCLDDHLPDAVST